MSRTGRKNSGRIFLRRGTYYLRYRINGKEKTVSLKIKEGEDNAKARANTEAAKYLPILKADTREEIAAQVAIAKRLQRESRFLALSSLWQTFSESQTRPDSGARTLEDYRQKLKFFLRWLKINLPLAEQIHYASSFGRTI
ncbi:MAG: hypothetical protein GY750_03670 [Lentisphaerae bacterium]|nr:hypothetical protein [Lentisphaerota bacterium]MCP4100514.1 hypothetical protein [Lentisphaerota bacterium]